MRHAKSKYKLNRFTSWRKATLKSIIRNLLIHQSIKTTEAKAKAARPMAEKLISLAKLKTLAAKRQAYRMLGDHKLVSLLFSEIGPRFNNRGSGYTRMLRLNTRRGDNAQLVIFQLSELKIKEFKKPKKEKEIKSEEKKEEPPKIIETAPSEEKKPKTGVSLKEKPTISKKPPKSFLGGLRKIFKKERDSL